MQQFGRPNTKQAIAEIARKIVHVITKPATSPASSLEEQQLDEIVDDIEEVLSVIQLRVTDASFRRLFRAKVIRNVLKATNSEIEKLCGPQDEYIQDLSLQESFIIRAGAIFEEANNLCAISIDELSQFWTAEGQRTRAQEYTARQPKIAKRLFVFSNFENAAKYRNIMAAHHQQYGETGGVFFCSKHSYMEFLKTVANNSEIEELKTKDFAILVFEDDAGKDYYESTLSQTKLVCRRLENIKNYQERILEYFEKMVFELEPGEEDNKFGFIRYTSDFQFNNKKWSIALAKIFDGVDNSSSFSGSIYHLVFISKSVPEKEIVDQINNNLRAKLLNLTHSTTSEKLLEDLWFGKRSQIIDNLKVIDGIHKGTIKTSNTFVDNYQYCLVMKFSNLNYLREYYQNEIHSEVRQQLYSLCDQTIKGLYKIISNPDKLNTEEKQKIYNAIEGNADKFFIRADYLQEDPINYILQIEAVPFELPSNNN